MIRALLLALALAGCEGQVHVESEDMGDGTMRYGVYYSRTWESVPIAQADPTKEADWPGLAQPCSLTVTNATPRTLLLEQAHVVTLAKPGDSLTVALEGSVTIREEASYDE